MGSEMCIRDSTDTSLTFQVNAGATTNWGMFGLDQSDPDFNFNTIDYAIYLANGTLGVYENGTSRGTFGTYANGDTFEVRRTGTTITYHHNGGAAFYTSGIASSTSLVFDSSIWRASNISNLQITY